MWNGTSTIELGLGGGVHTSSNGTQDSNVSGRGSNGWFYGSSRRYSGTTSVGSTAWYWDGNSTVQLGFSGGVYTGTSGRQSSIIRGINSSGQAYGGSTRYSGTTVIGAAA